MMQIEEARRALEELTTDEAELARIHAEQAKRLRTLQDRGVTDPELEAKHAALSTMLTEQRGHIGNARFYLVALETEQIKSGQLDQLRGKVAKLLNRREETDALLLHFGTMLTEQISKITAARVAWLADLEEAQEEARSLFALPHPGQVAPFSSSRADWLDAFNEIGPRAQEALTYSPASTFVSGLEQGYMRPQGAAGSTSSEQWPVSAYLDRPVTLTIAQVLEEQHHLAPRPFGGGHR